MNNRNAGPQVLATRFRSSRAGVATTELALSLPVLLLLLLAAVDYARVSFVACALANAVGASSHYAATHRVTERNETDWETTIQELAQAEMAETPGFVEENLTLTAVPTVNGDGETVVELNGSCLFSPLVDWPGMPGQFLLRKSVTVVQYQ
ncbi:TadE/TadG family type IV pilus assembly protein [Rubinisphaera sp. JC750]|uniref:TadE/TadG family type IV pilus assembly protein n=1 Tax=Rubinisphaera sp. JC750 TaxID=2898658 RepID=UPI001F3BCE56|nr:TadE/TadG family type IV pilus assembly protein [Rubinisphaera sp. JC750]